LRDHAAEFDRRHVKILVVTFESGYFARSYIEETSLPWPLLIDDKRETYKNYMFISASFWNIWGPKTWWVYLKEILKGEKFRKSEGDIFQRGGDVLIDPKGLVRLHHIGKGPADRPTVEMILKKIDI
jgi:peroxiredoxin